MNDLFLGVDAGNTKTIAAVSDRHGNILGWARGGLGDIYGVDAPEEATTEVLLLVDQAVSAARRAFPEGGARIAAGAFRLAGVDWPEDAELWNGVLRSRLGPEVSLSIKNDGFALLRYGDPDGVGVAVSLGTGAAIAGRGRHGEEFAMSWWLQHPLGAAGLVDEALRAIYLAELGMAAKTSLSRSLPRFYDAASVEDLLHAFTRRENAGGSHLHRSTAVRTVLHEAEAGDPVAIALVHEQAERVIHYISSCARRVGLLPGDGFTVTLGGSVAAADNVLRAAIPRRLAAAHPQARVVTEHAEPILGAVLDALAEGGVAPTAAVRDAVTRWRPDR
ncbi:N-acetylglucosamine kinase [Streptomyces mayteni]